MVDDAVPHVFEDTPVKGDDEELLKRIESVLFAAGKKLSMEDIAKLCNKRSDLARIEAGLQKLKDHYANSDSSLMVVQDGNDWKLTVRDHYLPFVRKIVTHTELKKSLMETLAVLAYKAPMMQSELIKTRTNKAYDHLVQLEEEGYITRKKKGRTKEIFLAPKFFEYFDIPEQTLREKFKSVKELELSVSHAELRLQERKGENARQKEEAKKRDAAFKDDQEKKVQQLNVAIKDHPAIELFDHKGRAHQLETYEKQAEPVSEPVPSRVEIIENKLGSLEIVKSEPRVEIIEGEVSALGEMEVVNEPAKEEVEEIIGPQSRAEAGDVDRRVAEILGGLSQSLQPEQDDPASKISKEPGLESFDLEPDQGSSGDRSPRDDVVSSPDSESPNDNSHGSFPVQDDSDKGSKPPKKSSSA